MLGILTPQIGNIVCKLPTDHRLTLVKQEGPQLLVKLGRSIQATGRDSQGVVSI